MNKLFLLTEEQYESNEDLIPSNGDWWLNEPYSIDNDMYIRHVHSDCEVYDTFVCDGSIGVRPAFKFKNDNHIYKNDNRIYDELELGSIIHFGNLKWIKLNDGIYLSKDILFNYRFDEDTYDYNTSDIRKKLKECEPWWFTKEELSMLENFDEDELSMLEDFDKV